MHATHRSRGARQRELRIIGGRWRGRKFRFPAGAIRPKPDRVRETLFNWLQGRIEGARCLDLYAGSGALGLEALSRGAASVVFVERELATAQALRGLLADWAAANASVIVAEARQYLADAAAFEHGFDLVFLDPPFDSGELAAAAAALAHGALAGDARIYLERAAAEGRAPALPPSWRELRTGKAGAVRYHLYAA